MSQDPPAIRPQGKPKKEKPGSRKTSGLQKSWSRGQDLNLRPPDYEVVCNAIHQRQSFVSSCFYRYVLPDFAQIFPRKFFAATLHCNSSQRIRPQPSQASPRKGATLLRQRCETEPLPTLSYRTASGRLARSHATQAALPPRSAYLARGLPFDDLFRCAPRAPLPSPFHS